MKDVPFMIFPATNALWLTIAKLLMINFGSFKEIMETSALYLSVIRVMLDSWHI